MRIIKANNTIVSVGEGVAVGAALNCSMDDNIQKDLFFNMDEILVKSQSNGHKLQRSVDKTNQEVDLRSVDGVKKELNRLRSKAIRLLAMREHSSQEMVAKLSTAGVELNVVQSVVDDLVDNNYLCDSRFTECFVRSKQTRGFGPSKIDAELKLKGIKNRTIDKYLKANSSIWFEVAQVQYQKKYGNQPIKDYNAWAKRARFMQSRGFGMGHIQATLPTIDHE